MAKKGGLGSGLDVLIPKKKKQDPQETVAMKAETGSGSNVIGEKGVFSADINQVEPNRNQPRKEFDEQALKELADSIRQYGVLQPLLVQKKEDYYEIVAGERRWRAAKLAGLKEVPVIMRELTRQEQMEISLIENIQREDLNPIEEARAYAQLIDEFGLKQNELAERVSKSRTAITNSMRLLKLSSDVQDMLTGGKLSVGHARALLALDDPKEQKEVADRIVEEHLNVRDTEKLLQTLASEKKKTEKKKQASTDSEQEFLYQHLEETMKQILGTKVSIRNRGKGGKIEIEYYSQDELDRLLLLIQSIPE